MPYDSTGSPRVTTAPGTWCVETKHRLVKVIHVWNIWQLLWLNVLHTKKDALHIKCIVPVMVEFHNTTCTVYLLILSYCLMGLRHSLWLMGIRMEEKSEPPWKRIQERTDHTVFIPVHFYFPWIIWIEFLLHVLNLGVMCLRQVGGHPNT